MADWKPPRTNRSKAAVAVAILAAATTIIKPFEGRVLHTYPDAVYGWKLPTACDGHTGPELHAGQTFTPAECDEMRNADLTKTFDGLAPCFGTAKLSNNEWGAYLALAYNLGDTAVCHSSIPAKVMAGRHADACATIEEFYNAGGKDCRIAANNCGGIPRRRAAEHALCVRP